MNSAIPIFVVGFIFGLCTLIGSVTFYDWVQYKLAMRRLDRYITKLQATREKDGRN